MHKLEAKFAETEVKKDEELKQIKRENSRMMAELDKVQRHMADIDLANAEFAEFTEQQVSILITQFCFLIFLFLFNSKFIYLLFLSIGLFLCVRDIVVI